MIYQQQTINSGKGNPAMDTLSSPAVGYATDIKKVTYYRNKKTESNIRYKTTDNTAHDFSTIQTFIKNNYQVSGTVNNFVRNSELDAEGYRTAYFEGPVTMVGAEGTVVDDVPSFTEVGPLFRNITESDYPKFSKIIIPDSVTSIGGGTDFGAFLGCIYLTNITLSSNITKIGDYAFTGCMALSSITIPDKVTSIGYYAFGQCTSLTSVSIPATVTSIGARAFNKCTSLSSVTCLATTPPTLGNNAFGNLPTGYKIYVPAASLSAYQSAWSTYAANIEAIP